MMECLFIHDIIKKMPETAKTAKDPKPKSNYEIYIKILRRMSPEQHLRKAFELSELTRALFIEGMRQRFPDLCEKEIAALIRKRLDQCHNRLY